VESPSLEIFKPRLDKVLCSLLWVTLLGQGVGLGDPQRSLPTPNMLWFCDFGTKTKKKGGSCFHSTEELVSVVGEAVWCPGELLLAFTVEEQPGFALADVGAFGFFPAEPLLSLSARLRDVGRKIFCQAEKNPPGSGKKSGKLGDRRGCEPQV